MSMMTGGQAVIRSLKSEGVEVVFGVPGVQIMYIYDAFYSNPDVQIITTRHEQTAAFMADGYARSTGKIGVALVVPGPGVYNAGAALSNAYATSSPVLLISGQINSAEIGKGHGALHEVHDQMDITKPVTKWSTLVTRAEEIPITIHEAMRQLKTGRPLPVEVSIPRDILATTTNVETIDVEKYPRSPAPSETIRAAANALASAKRPLIWAGAGVNLVDAGRELQEMAELLGAPVTITTDSRGVIPDTHTLAFTTGGFGDGGATDLMRRSDAILALGPRFAIPQAAEWVPDRSKPLIHMDVEREEFGRSVMPTLSIQVDAKTGLQQLLDSLRGQRPSGGWDREELALIKREQRERAQQKQPNQVDMGEKIRQVLPEDAILIKGITMGSGWTTMGGSPTLRPRTLLTASYMITLGYSFPTAMGAKVGNPNRPVLALCGDGGFMYAVGDLATAVRYGINVVTVVFNNNMYGQSYYDQKTRFEGRVVGTQLLNPDFMKLAESFGVKGMRVKELDDLPGTLEKAISACQPTLVEVSEKTTQLLTTPGDT